MRCSRALPAALILLAVLILLPSVALAEGYNKGTLIQSTDGWGALSDDERLQYDVASNPHGGYTTTTNKCQDCHSTHYAIGSYKLLRAHTRAATCDFCHGGGGGSTKNIMMDNAYTASAADMVSTLGPAADATITAGFGTGHTLGYVGRAPADIRPAFSEPEGFSCFNCHTPHGNSARALTTFAAPGSEIVPGHLSHSTHYRFDFSVDFTLVEVYVQEQPPGTSIEDVALKPADLIARDAADPGYVFDQAAEAWGFVWGVERYSRNIAAKSPAQLLGVGVEDGDWVYDLDPTDPAQGMVSRKPIYATGKFLLIKNPDNENGAGRAGDLDVSTVASSGVDLVTDGNNKVAIDWDYVADEPVLNFYLASRYRTSGKAGLPTVGEFCTDCHDGTAGLSKQPAEVWFPAVNDYMVAYAHDSSPGGNHRRMLLNPDDDENFGPQCRNCHSGASACSQCHADTTTSFEAQPSFTNVRNSTYQNVDANAACLEGGFSYPHRTLAANMLKDSLWGVDFDGTPLAPGEIRGEGLTLSTIPGAKPGDGFLQAPRTYQADQLVDAATENLDSACIDCHNPNIWNGDDPSFFVTQTVKNRDIVGWDLLMKGLP